MTILNKVGTLFSLAPTACSRWFQAGVAIPQHQVLVCCSAEHGFHSQGPRELRIWDKLAGRRVGKMDKQPSPERCSLEFAHTSSTSILLARN